MKNLFLDFVDMCFLNFVLLQYFEKALKIKMDKHKLRYESLSSFFSNSCFVYLPGSHGKPFNSLNNHSYWELVSITYQWHGTHIALLRSGGRVAEWIAYHLLVL